MADQGQGRILPVEEKEEQHQEAGQRVGLLAGLKVWLEERVAKLQDDAVAPEAVPQPTLLDRVFDFFSGTQAPEREYVLADISGSETMLQPNPEYVPPPYDELQANMGGFVPSSTPAVERSSSSVLAV